MNAKDVAVVILFVLFVLSVMGNAFLLFSSFQSGYKERDLEQEITNLEAEKTNMSSGYQRQIEELEDENEDLQEEIVSLEKSLDQLKSEFKSQSGTSVSYESLVNSLRIRVYDLEAETLQLQSDLNTCRAEKSYSYSCRCDPCSHCSPYYGYGCHHSISVSNAPGTYGGHPYDAVIYVYFSYYPCHVLKIYVDILDLNTISIVGVDWD